MKLISVIIPVFNSEKYIEKCIQSILEQTYKNVEIIIVDDGSTDNSCIIAENLLRGSRMDYVLIHQENQGVAAARNHGIEMAHGKWIIAIDSDDCIHKETFQTVMKNVGEADAAMFDFEINGSGNEFKISDENITFLSGCAAIEGFYSRKYKFIAPATLVKKDFLIDNGIFYDETCRFAEDDLYVWKILCKAKEVMYINRPLYNYIFHDNSTMTTPNIDKFMSTKQPSIVVSEVFIGDSTNAKQIKDMFLFRHYLGILHAAAKVHSFEEFCRLISYFEMSQLYKKIYKKVSIKTKGSFALILIAPRLVYRVFKNR